MLLSSHQLPEVQELCDRVAIVDRGRVVYEGALADLRRQGGAGYRLRSTDDARALERAARATRHRARRTAANTASGFQAQEGDVGALSLALARADIGILALTPELATLEDLFFRLTEDQRRRRRRADAAPEHGSDDVETTRAASTAAERHRERAAAEAPARATRGGPRR